MNKILVNNKNFNFTEFNLPVLIHGEEGLGASLYTITLAINLAAQKNYSVIFLCGYDQAKEEFMKQIGEDFDENQIVIYTEDQITEFKKLIEENNAENSLIIIKNIEIFDESIFDLVSSKKEIVISGDINKCNFKNKILSKKFTTKIFFSPMDDTKFPNLQKYEGFFVFNSLEGITKVDLVEKK